MNSLTEQMGRMRISPWKMISEVKIANVHQDDIHALLKRNECFYSGSKDGTIACWDLEGKKVRDITTFARRDYTRWVTALSTCGAAGYVAGFRNGDLDLYNDKDLILDTIRYMPDGRSQGRHGFSNANGYICKDRNQQRITCLTDYTGEDGKKKFFLGAPSAFELIDFATSEVIAHQKVHANDWIYCITPLAQRRLAIVVGATLEIWKPSQEGWEADKTLIHESSESKRHQRPLISSVQPLDNLAKMAFTDFQGAVKVVDIETGKLMRLFSEHEGRAWHIVSLTPALLASGADDRTVKIWDARMDASVLTFSRHPGRVSQLLVRKDLSFIAASCPDDVKNSVNKAEFTLRDLRKNN